MRQCWEEEPEDRPSFQQLYEDLLVCFPQHSSPLRLFFFGTHSNSPSDDPYLDPQRLCPQLSAKPVTKGSKKTAKKDKVGSACIVASSCSAEANTEGLLGGLNYFILDPNLRLRRHQFTTSLKTLWRLAPMLLPSTATTAQKVKICSVFFFFFLCRAWIARHTSD